MIVVISCGAKKAATAQPIEDLYIGPYFKAMRRWAESMAPRDRLFVLSARYGLVPFGTVREPYEQRMSQAGAITSEALRTQAEALGLTSITAGKVIVVGGKPYVNAIREVVPSAEAPFARFPGIGYQLQAMKNYRGQVPA